MKTENGNASDDTLENPNVIENEQINEQNEFVLIDTKTSQVSANENLTNICQNIIPKSPITNASLNEENIKLELDDFKISDETIESQNVHKMTQRRGISKEKTFACRNFEKSFTKLQILRQHIKLRHDKKSFQSGNFRKNYIQTKKIKFA